MSAIGTSLGAKVTSAQLRSGGRCRCSSQLLQSAGPINLAKRKLPTIQGQGLKDVHEFVTKAKKRDVWRSRVRRVGRGDKF